MVRKPFFRAFDGWWYVQLRVGGKRVQRKLVRGPDNEAEAWRRFYKVMAEEAGTLPQASSLTIAQVCDLFLRHSEREHDPSTFRWYQKFLQSFCDRSGTLLALDVKPFHVTAWLHAHPRWQGARRCAVICLKRAYNWCEGEGILPSNPLKRVKKPPAVRRERILAEEWRQLFVAIKDRAFRDFVFALKETGCRPSEVRRVTAADVNFEQGLWILREHKTKKKTGKPRVIYLTLAMVDLTRRLVERHPDGPLFRGPRGAKPFSRNAVRCRFRRLREKLPHLKGVISYTLRHTYITDALERGVPVATVAELAGHSDLKMIEQHYGHLSEKRQHLREAASRAAGYAATLPERKEPA